MKTYKNVIKNSKPKVKEPEPQKVEMDAKQQERVDFVQDLIKNSRARA